MTLSSLLLFLLLGLRVVDADLAMQKKEEVKMLLELANHDATFAVNEALKTEGIIDLVEDEAMARFSRRMSENGGYTRQGSTFIPSPASVTTDPIACFTTYVDFRTWRHDVDVSLRFTGSSLVPERIAVGDPVIPSGGHATIAVTDDKGNVHRLSPKKMVGPSLVVVGYVRERPLSPLLPSHGFPVASVEELKW